MSREIKWICDRCGWQTITQPNNRPLSEVSLPEHGTVDVCQTCGESIIAAVGDVLGGELGYE